VLGGKLSINLQANGKYTGQMVGGKELDTTDLLEVK